YRQRPGHGCGRYRLRARVPGRASGAATPWCQAGVGGHLRDLARARRCGLPGGGFMALSQARRTGHAEPLVGLDPGKLRKVKPHELTIRFAFGAAISIVAGVVSLVAGPAAGGMFLAFPALLPAPDTLVAADENNAHAGLDVQGAGRGARAPVV